VLLARKGQLPASTIAHKFRVSAPAISQHLQVLRAANLVRMEKRAQQRIYSINPDAMHELEDWARQMTALWNERLDALEELLKTEQSKTPKPKGRKEKLHDKAR
jgi:DNA-binding transcriptional ArsR family regulator